jgi:hypothetical protein
MQSWRYVPNYVIADETCHQEDRKQKNHRLHRDRHRLYAVGDHAQLGREVVGAYREFVSVIR